MPHPCQDNYSITFSSLSAMTNYHAEQVKSSNWERLEVSQLQVAPLTTDSPLYGDMAAFADCVSEDAVKDTASNLGLAVKMDGKYYGSPALAGMPHARPGREHPVHLGRQRHLYYLRSQSVDDAVGALALQAGHLGDARIG